MTADLLAVDLGKTGCRVRRCADGLVAERSGPGAPGLAEPGGAAAAARAVLGLVDDAAPGAVCVGAAGAVAAPDAADELSAQLAAALGTRRVAVTSDAVTAHAGALDGAPGVVLAVGTGVVATAVAADGTVTLVDGWGHWLGDEGGGAWIGRAGLAGVLRARDGRGAATALTAAAAARYGDLDALPAALAAHPARATAAFAPDVLQAADSGDPVAERVRVDAAAALAATTRAALRVTGPAPVTAVGGLAVALWEAWSAALPAGTRVVAARGGALDGAVLLATRTDLPHEARVRRRAEEGA